MAALVDSATVSISGLESFPVSGFRFAVQKSTLAGTIRGSYFVIKGEN